jgi:hypothetical protein
MTSYAGLDVSLGQTSVWVIDEAGEVVRERRVATEPEAPRRWRRRCRRRPGCCSRPAA